MLIYCPETSFRVKLYAYTTCYHVVTYPLCSLTSQQVTLTNARTRFRLAHAAWLPHACPGPCGWLRANSGTAVQEGQLTHPWAPRRDPRQVSSSGHHEPSGISLVPSGNGGLKLLRRGSARDGVDGSWLQQFSVFSGVEPCAVLGFLVLLPIGVLTMPAAVQVRMDLRVGWGG